MRRTISFDSLEPRRLLSTTLDPNYDIDTGWIPPPELLIPPAPIVVFPLPIVYPGHPEPTDGNNTPRDPIGEPPY